MLRSIHCAGAIGALISLSLLGGWSAVQAADAKAPDYEAIVAAPDRSDADRQTDVRRQPAKILAFTGVKSGMKVLDMGAGAGYSTELMARAVGPEGHVYAQESAAVMERVKDKFDIRAQSPVMKNTVHLIRNYDDPIPPEVSGLDLITFFFAYHDVTYMPADRAAMNRKMFAALKPGGLLRQEIEAAGFKLVAEGDFLKHPEDPRDAAVFRPAVPVDEFVLKYQKPL